MQRPIPIVVTSTSGYKGEFPSIKMANQILFKGNILVYKSIIKVLNKNKKTPIKHETHGNLYFWYKD